MDAFQIIIKFLPPHCVLVYLVENNMLFVSRVAT